MKNCQKRLPVTLYASYASSQGRGVSEKMILLPIDRNVCHIHVFWELCLFTVNVNLNNTTPNDSKTRKDCPIPISETSFSLFLLIILVPAWMPAHANLGYFLFVFMRVWKIIPYSKRKSTRRKNIMCLSKHTSNRLWVSFRYPGNEINSSYNRTKTCLQDRLKDGLLTPELLYKFLSKYIIEIGVGKKTQWYRDGRTCLEEHERPGRSHAFMRTLQPLKPLTLPKSVLFFLWDSHRTLLLLGRV